MADKNVNLRLTATDATKAAFGSAQASLRGLADGVDSFRTSIAGAFGSVASIAGSIGAGLSIKGIAQMADDFSNLQARLKLASRDLKEFNAANADLQRIAAAAKAPLSETATLYTRIAASVKDLSVSQSQIAGTTEAVALALRISGASAGEASSAMLQFSQAIASGVLRGEEFNAVNESAPRLLQALARSLSVPVGELREMAKQGQLTRDVLINGLLAELPQLRTEAASLPQTIGAAFTGLQNKLLLTIGEFDKLTQATSGVARAIDSIGTTAIEALAVTGANVAFVFKSIGREIGGIAAQLAALARGDFKGFSEIGRLMKDDARSAREELDAFENRMLGSARIAADTARNTVRSVGEVAKAVSAFSDAQNKAAKERADVIARYMERELNAAIALQQAMVDAYDKARLDERIAAERMLADQVDRLNDLYDDRALAESNSIEAAERMIRAIEDETALIGMSNEARETAIALRELERNGIDLTVEAMDRYRQRLRDALGAKQVTRAAADAAKQAADEWDRTAQTIEQSLTDALLRGFESGKDFAENLRDTLKNMFNTLILRPIIQPIAQAGASAVLGGVGSLFSGMASAGGLGNLSTLSTLGGGFGNIGGGLLGGLGSSISAGLFSSLGGAGASQAALLASQTAGFGAFGTGSTLSAMGSSAGGLISGLGAALPFIGGALAIGAALGLFGGKPSNKAAYGTVDLGTGALSDLVGMTGNKAPSSQTLSARDALVQGIAGYSGLLRGLGGSLSGTATLDIGERDGINAALFGGAKKSYGSDPAAAIGEIYRDMVAGTAGLSDAVRTLLTEFEGTGDELGAFTQSLALARDVMIPTLEDLGFALGDMEGEALKAAMQVVDLAGGLEAFASQTSYFMQQFYSDAEQLTLAQDDLTAAFDAISLSVPATRDAFRALVEAQDLLTAGGRETYAALLQLAPAFVSVQDAMDATTQAALQAAQAQRQAADALRAAGAAAVLAGRQADAAFQASIYAAQGAERTARIEQAKDDLQAAYDREVESLKKQASALTDAAQKMRDYQHELLAGNEAIDVATSYSRALAQFSDTAMRARLGDLDAAAAFRGDAESFLNVSRVTSATAVDYRRDLLRVAGAAGQTADVLDRHTSIAEQQLDALNRLVDLTAKSVEVETNLTVRQAMANLDYVRADWNPRDPLDARRFHSYYNRASGDLMYGRDRAATEDRELRAEVVALREEQRAQARAMASSLIKFTKIVDKWDIDGMPDVRAA